MEGTSESERDSRIEADTLERLFRITKTIVIREEHIIIMPLELHDNFVGSDLFFEGGGLVPAGIDLGSLLVVAAVVSSRVQRRSHFVG